jgi:V8-like Glu-specific endopeptidase
MIELKTEDRQALINMLLTIELLGTPSGRREALRMANLRKVTHLIDVSGATFEAVSRIVGVLETYGRLTYDNEALGVFLNALKPAVGVQQQDLIDRLLLEYEMMVPVAPGAALADWKSSDSPEAVQEKIIGADTLRPIAFLERGVEISRSVAYVGVRQGWKGWSGTGFLIAPDLAMTNHHVVPEKSLRRGVRLRFNYQESFAGEAQPVEEYSAKPDGLFHANEALDYAVFEVEGEPGRRWGWLPLAPRDVRKDDRINIIQHPNGLPKQISLQNNLVQYVGGNVVQYVTSTNPGSSGSPVLNDGWDVVALHHAGGDIPEPTTGRQYLRNQGILMLRILADLPQELKERVEAAALGM